MFLKTIFRLHRRQVIQESASLFFDAQRQKIKKRTPYILKGMNFLAHFFLAKREPAWVVGNFVADYLRNAEVAGLPEAVREGVALHRSIDGFTDSHPLVRQCTQRLHPIHGKYAPVVIDVFFDFFLIHNWECYSEEPFDAFVQQVYDILLESREILPEGLRDRLPRMVSGGWLHSYGQLPGLEYAFLRLQSRMSKPEQLSGVMDTHHRYFDAINQDFNDFFPEAIAFASDWKLR